MPCVEGLAHASADRRFHRAQRERSVSGDLLGQRSRRFGELRIWNDVVNDIHVTAALGVEEIGGVENPGGVGRSADLDQLAGEIVRHHQADTSERYAELRVLRRDSKVTMQRKFEPSRKRGTLHCGDGRDRKTFQPSEYGLERGWVVNAACLIHFLKIDPGAKARAFASEQECTDFAIVFELAERLVERVDQWLIQRVALFGTIESQHRVVRLARNFKYFLGHIGRSSRTV